MCRLRSTSSLMAVSLAGALSAAPAWAADFEYFVAETSQVSAGGQDYSVIDVYAQFVQNSVHVVNLYDASIANANATAFHHSDINTISSLPGTWVPNLSLPVGGANPAIDTFVTVGGAAGSGNTTTSRLPMSRCLPPTRVGTTRIPRICRG